MSTAGEECNCDQALALKKSNGRLSHMLETFIITSKAGWVPLDSTIKLAEMMLEREVADLDTSQSG